MQEANNGPRTEPEIKEPERTAETTEATQRPRPSLADRLMNPETPAVRRERPSATPTSAPVTARPAPERPAASPAATARPTPERQPATAAPAQSAPPPRFFNSSSFEDGLNQAIRYIRLQYFAFLASLTIVFVLFVSVTSYFVISALNDSGWERIAASGGVAAFMVLVLLALQYRPPRGFSSAAAQLSHLEATRASVNKSIEFWERFLADKQLEHGIESKDVALAVESMAAVSRELGHSEVEPEARRSENGAVNRSAQSQTSSQRVTRTTPDPRRY